MKKNYNHQEIEKKWAERWVDRKTFTPDLKKAKNPYYSLFMFPYPSAEGLHIGNFYAFTCVDIMAKYKKLQGFDVFEPIGWDAFGIHSENYAMKIGETPTKMLSRTIPNFRKQLKATGLSCDWTREVDTTSPEYYKWTQWIFTKLFEKGLAYQKKAWLNWCPSCKTVLADEQIEGGSCERCKTTPEKKEMKQWFFKITEYANEMLEEMKEMDWSNITKTAQKEWIGKSEGAKVKFRIKDFEEEIEVFTTRPDTLFGCTYMVLAPEHELVSKLQPKISNYNEVEKYVKKAQAKSDLERQENKEKTGVKLEGVLAINPANQEEIPIFVADYVLTGYGTGAIMAVPAHDERDFEFAKKFNIDIKQVIVPEDGYKGVCVTETLNQPDILKQKLLDEKIDFHITESTISKREHINFQTVNEKIDDLIKLIQKNLKGENWVEILGTKNIVVTKNETHYNFLSDPEKWLKRFKEIEPLVKGQESIWSLLDKNDFLREYVCFVGEGLMVNSGKFDGMKSEEAKKKITKFVKGEMTVNYKLRDWCISRQRYWGPPVPVIYCEKCGVQAVPEKDLPVRLPEMKKNWEPAGDGRGPLAKVDEFMKTTCPKCDGPAEREADVMDNFFDSAWYFLRYLDSKNEDKIFDAKLGKKWLPVDFYVGGNEHAVLHLMYTRFITRALYDVGLLKFTDPFKKFRANGMILKDGKKMSKSKGNVINPDEYGERISYDALKTYMLFLGPLSEDRSFQDDGIVGVRKWMERIHHLAEKVTETDNQDLEKELHKTIKKVTSDLEQQKYNTAVAKLMEFTNLLMKEKEIPFKVWKKFVVLLAPFTPALAEELYQDLGGDIFEQKKVWPEYDEDMIQGEEIIIPVQVNGKRRGELKVPVDISEEDILDQAKESPELEKWLEGDIKKVVFVPNKILNLVVNN